jgi:hypothetical protein
LLYCWPILFNVFVLFQMLLFNFQNHMSCLWVKCNNVNMFFRKIY